MAELRVGAVPGRRRADPADAAALRRRPGRRAVGDGLPGRRRRARRRGHRRGRDACGRRRWTQQQRASAALEQAKARQDEVAARVAELEAAADAVTDELDAALGDVDRQLAAAAEGADRRQRPDGGQLAGLRRPADRGRASRSPPAAQLTRPAVGSARRAGPGGGRERGSAAGSRAAAAPADVAAGAPGRDPRRGHRGDGRPGAALRARDRRPGVVGLRLAGAVGVRGRGHLAARRPRPTCSPSRRRSAPPTCCRATWCSSATPSPASGTWASRWTRRPCSPPTPGPARSSSGPCRPTRCWASAGRASASGRRWPPRARRAARCGWSAATPSTRRATTAPGSGAAIPNGLIPPSAMCPLGVAGHVAAVRRRRGLPGDVGGLRDRLRLADLHHRLLSHLRQPGPAVRAEAGARRRPRHQQPRLGAGRRPLRRHRALRHARRTPG